MGSPSLFHFFFLIPMLLMIINPSHASREIMVTEEDPNKVNVSVYYESLCEGCEFFIGFSVAYISRDLEFMSIVNLHLVPYGNAKTSQNGSVDCQFGPDECYFNTIEACALEIQPLDMSLLFIECVEDYLLQGQTDKQLVLDICDNYGLRPQLFTCYSSGHGNELLKSYGRETGALNPPLKFVPWVTINGTPLDDRDHLVKHICDAYKGQQKIKACNNTHVASSLTGKKRSTQSVCHANLESGAPIITV